jgi:hypothetical protein
MKGLLLALVLLATAFMTSRVLAQGSVEIAALLETDSSGGIASALKLDTNTAFDRRQIGKK